MLPSYNLTVTIILNKNFTIIFILSKSFLFYPLVSCVLRKYILAISVCTCCYIYNYHWVTDHFIACEFFYNATNFVN